MARRASLAWMATNRFAQNTAQMQRSLTMVQRRLPARDEFRAALDRAWSGEWTQGREMELTDALLSRGPSLEAWLFEVRRASAQGGL